MTYSPAVAAGSPIKSVQRGVTSHMALSGTNDIGIAAVNPAKALLVTSGTSGANSTQQTYGVTLRSDGLAIRILTPYTGQYAYFGWEVIEYA